MKEEALYHFYRNRDFITGLDNYTRLKNQLVFVFFDPWAIRHNKVAKIVDFIKAHGFKILLYNYKILTDSDIEQIYRKNPPITMNTSWHVPKEVYTMGESCGILFFHPSDDPPASMLMKDIKGKSSPLSTTALQIRYEFRAPNKSLSLMHSSDDWYSMLNECSPFFSRSLLMKTFDRFINESSSNHKDIAFCNSVYESMEYVKEQSATNLFLKLRIRIIDILLNETGEISQGDLLKNFWIEKNSTNYLNYSVGKEIAEYKKIIAAENQPLTNFINSFPHFSNYCYPRLYHYNHDTAGLINALRILNDSEHYFVMDGDEIVKSIPVFFDQWEKLLFKTTLFHFSELEND